MKKIALSLFLAILLFALPQAVSTSPGSEGTYVFELKWGTAGNGDGQFNMPRSVAVDSSGNVYVADTNNHRIQKFDSDGGFLGWWGLGDDNVTGWHNPNSGAKGIYGSGDGQLRNPWGLCVDSDDNVYVADTLNNRIQKFDSYGSFLKKLGKIGTGDGEFYLPYDVAVDSAGYIYVVDTYSHRIQKLDSDGVFQGWIGLDNFGFTGWHNPGTGSIGVSGTGDGQFNWPRGIAADSDGNVYVADTSSHRIQKFDSFGVFLGWWGFGDDDTTGWHNPGTGSIGVSGTGDGQFKSPWGVAVDLDNNVYVADTSNQRFQKFDSSGVFLGWWGLDDDYKTEWHPPGTGRIPNTFCNSGDGQFCNPYDVTVDLDDNVFVVDTFNRRIQKFDLVPPLGVTSPNGGEIWFTDTIHDITWETGVGNDYVKIEFSDNDGTDWEEIVAFTENDGLYEDWDVPCNLSAECLVRISGLDDFSFDVSDYVFSIESDTLPVITLIGLSEMVLECGIDTYYESGATAEDGCGNDVPVVIKGDEVDTMTCGTYEITYDAIDDTGQAATQVIRIVIVRDTTPPDPVVDPLPEVVGECSVFIETEPTATDNCAGLITGATSEPRGYTKSGTYTVTWAYDDGNGNTTTQTQTVTVDDKTPPVPDLADLPDVKGECSAAIMTAPTATDNCAGIITGTSSDPREYTKSGSYTVTWVYDDGNGNIATQTQTVKVEDVMPPTIDLSDSTCVDVHKWKNANMLTVSATDNCSSDVELTIDKIEIFNNGGRRVWGRGIYRVVGNDIYVFPNGRDWSIRVTVTAADGNGNTTTESISKPLQQCNRWSAQMARLIRLIHIFLWRSHHCW